MKKLEDFLVTGLLFEDGDIPDVSRGGGGGSGVTLGSNTEPTAAPMRNPPLDPNPSNRMATYKAELEKEKQKKIQGGVYPGGYTGRDKAVVDIANRLKNMSSNYDDLSTEEKSNLDFIKFRIKNQKEKGDTNFESDLTSELGDEHKGKLGSLLSVDTSRIRSDVSSGYAERKRKFEQEADAAVEAARQDTKISGTDITYGDWQKKYGHAYDAFNPQDRNIAITSHSMAKSNQYTPAAQETLRTAYELDTGLNKWNTDLQRKQGELDRAYDRSALEYARFKYDPDYRKAQIAKETEATKASPEFDDEMAMKQSAADAKIDSLKKAVEAGRNQALYDLGYGGIEKDLQRSGARTIQEPERSAQGRIPSKTPSATSALVNAGLNALVQPAKDVWSKVQDQMKLNMAQTMPTSTRTKTYGDTSATGAGPFDDVQRGQFPIDMYTDMEQKTGIQDPSIKNRIGSEQEPLEVPTSGQRNELDWFDLAYNPNSPFAKKFSRREEAPEDLSDYTSGRKYAVPGSVVWGKLSQHEKAQMAKRAIKNNEAHKLVGGAREATTGGVFGIGGQGTGRYHEGSDWGGRVPDYWKDTKYANMTMGQYLNTIMDEDEAGVEGDGPPASPVVSAAVKDAGGLGIPETQKKRFQFTPGPLKTAELLSKYRKKYSRPSEAPTTGAVEGKDSPYKISSPTPTRDVSDETHPQKQDVDERLMVGIRSQARAMARAHVDDYYKRTGKQRSRSEALDYEDSLADQYERALIDYYVGKKQRTE